jgi:hypothetical protein
LTYEKVNGIIKSKANYNFLYNYTTLSYHKYDLLSIVFYYLNKYLWGGAAMEFGLTLISSSLMDKQAVREILKCNSITSQYGLTLSGAEAAELVETRSQALRKNGRIEFGGGIIDKIVLEFCDSPFISQNNYTCTLNDLVETFYYFKNESMDNISDDELISLMKRYFDNNCQGSVELLQNRELETLAHNIKYNIDAYGKIDQYNAEEYYEYFDEEKWYE